jgi:hypothetical protein
MHQPSLKRVLIVALLAGGLAFAGTAQAEAASFEPSQEVWKWLTLLWEEGVTVLWERPGAGPDDGVHGKAGMGIDHSVTTPATGPACRASTEQGVCIDPNG